MASEDLDLDQAAQRVRHLEQEAIAMHDLAQRLNKEGRFQEAQAAYASMHRLEDEASALAARVGCVACVLGEAQPQEGEPSLCNLDPEALEPYQQLHPVLPWSAAGDSGASAVPSAGLGPEDLAARAVSCVVGSALADAAAMGVHWVYDLDVLEQIEGERRQMAAASAASSSSSAAPPPPSESASTQPALSGTSGPMHPSAFGLEFMDPPRSPFYAYASGRNSPYGEQTLVLLRSLAEGAGPWPGLVGDPGQCSGSGSGPGLHCSHYAELFSSTFGPDSDFDGYRDVSTKGFLRNYGRGMPPPLSGANDAQANCVARLAPLVAAFGAPLRATCGSTSGDGRPAAQADAEAAGVEATTGPELLQCVELATRVTQNTDAAVSWACVGAAVLELILAGATAEAAVRHVLHDLQDPQGRLAPYCRDMAPELASHMARVLQLRATPVPEATVALGRNCHMPNALQTPLQVVLHTEHLLGLPAAGSLQGDAGNEREGSCGRTGTPGDAVKTATTGERAPGQSGDGGAEILTAGSAAVCGGGAGLHGSSLPAEAYVWGVRLAVREGGCCASRAAYVGACLGALVAQAGGAPKTAGGTGGGSGGAARGAYPLGLPKDWLDRYSAAAQVRTWAATIVGGRLRTEVPENASLAAE